MVKGIMQETCQALWDALQSELLPVPNEDMWRGIAQRFETKWNFPNCIGAIDGKHVMMQCPNSGSKYYNYKGYFSMVLLAMVDADYYFILLDIGSYGSNSDGGIFVNCALGMEYMDHRLSVPTGQTLPGMEHKGPMPFVMIGDAAFPGCTDLLRPYPGRKAGKPAPFAEALFNYCLSQACRCSENAFGILAQWFQLYHRRLCLLPETAQQVIQATCILHNFLTQPTDYILKQAEILSIEYEDGLKNLHNLRGNHASKAARSVCKTFKDYFRKTGSVGWQSKSVMQNYGQEESSGSETDE